MLGCQCEPNFFPRCVKRSAHQLERFPTARACELTASREAPRRAQTSSGNLDLVRPFQAREAGMIAADLGRTACDDSGERIRPAAKVYPSRDQARADVFDYIERFYNPR